MTAATAFMLSLILAGCLPVATALRERLPIGYLPSLRARPTSGTPERGGYPMERAAIRAGAIVCLKSGGPPMTANRAEGDAWECLWFVGDQLQSALFAEDALEPYTSQWGAKPIITPYRSDESSA